VTSKIFDSNGLHIAIQLATSNEVGLLVKWDVPGNAKPVTVEWQPSSIEGKSIRTNIPNGLTPIIVPRPSKQTGDTLLVGTVPGYTSEYIRLTPIPDPLPSPPCRKTNAQNQCVICSDSFTGGTHAGAQLPFDCPNMAIGKYVLTVKATITVDTPVPGAGVWIDGFASFPNMPNGQGQPTPPQTSPGSITFIEVFRAGPVSVTNSGNLAAALNMTHCQTGADNGHNCDVGDGSTWTIEPTI
jgi:hypothetical protein